MLLLLSVLPPLDGCAYVSGPCYVDGEVPRIECQSGGHTVVMPPPKREVVPPLLLRNE